jgi:general nucleoside transport system permease protein
VSAAEPIARRAAGRIGAAARPLASAAVALAIAAAVIAALGFPAGAALRALAVGSFGSGAALTATLLKTAPLLLTGLSVALAFRCGVWNIGAEGQLLAGALAATAIATRAAPAAPAFVLVPLVVVAGAAAAAALGALAGWLRATRGVSEVISTILLNFIAIQAVAWAVTGPLQEAGGAYPQSDAFPAAARLPAIGRLHSGVWAALAAAAALAWLLFRTPLGFRLRAVGHSPVAARFAGIPPERYGVAALAIAGALAGAAGAFEVAGVSGRLYQGLSPGYGYTAIAVALLARLHPIAVVPSALFFGALEAGAGAMQREAGIPAVATEVVQGVVILLSVSFALGRRT